MDDAVSSCRVGATFQNPHFGVRRVKAVIGALIQHDPRIPALGELPARSGCCPVIGGAHQDQRLQSRLPFELSQDCLAAGIKRDRGAKFCLPGRLVRSKRPEQGRSAARPAEDSNFAGIDKWLGGKPVCGGAEIFNPAGIFDGAIFLFTEVCVAPRSIAAREQNHIPPCAQSFSPVGMARSQRSVALPQTAAAVQSYNSRERTLALRAQQIAFNRA